MESNIDQILVLWIQLAGRFQKNNCCNQTWLLKKSVIGMSFGCDYRCCRVFSSHLS